MNGYHGTNNTSFSSEYWLNLPTLTSELKFHLRHRRASEQAYVFMRKADDWGRMFSYVELIAKVFPKLSDYDLLRNSAQDMYANVKVR